MLKWMLHRQLAAFERSHHYDASFMHHVLDTDLGAFLRFGFATGMGSYRKDVPLDALLAAGLTSSIQADCGPCTQLGTDLGLEAGVEASTVAAIISGDAGKMSPEVALGVQFARAVLAHSAEVDGYRAEIGRRWGSRAVLALTFAVMTAQLYPTLKYALGHGKACMRVRVGGETIVPRHALTGGE